MQAIKRQRLGVQAWRALLVQFAGSGLTVAAFCRRESIGTASFYRWRSQLGASSADATQLPVAAQRRPIRRDAGGAADAQACLDAPSRR